MEKSSSFSLFVDRPREINVTEFVQQRALEISNLMAVVDNKDLPKGEVAQGPRTFIQRQPRHMRRRAMSYNVKRLPRRKRAMAGEIIEEHKHRKKPPSRYYRRRPVNLLKAYANRQRKVKWLETHIWHAKRFRTTVQFGWKIPYSNCQRGFRASYRDSTRHCTVQDISYYSCFEFFGPESTLIEHLNKMCSPKVGLSFKSTVFLNGQLEGTIVLYEPGKYPYGCLGKVSFLWNPTNHMSNTRQLWIWVHPSFEKELYTLILKLFSFEEKPADQVDSKTVINVSSDLHSNLNLGVQFHVLKESLLKFRLTGPKSTAILNDIFVEPDFELVESKFETSDNQAIVWEMWKKHYSRLQPGQLKPGQVISLVVEDPRLKLDYRKQIPADNTGDSVPTVVGTDAILAQSPLWCAEARKHVQQTKLSDSALNKIRSDHSLVQLKVDHSVIEPNLVPVLLCQKPGDSGTSHFGSGWDVVLPASWGMPFWLAFQYRTARAAGLAVEQKVDFECNRLNFSSMWPDTLAGREFAECESQKLQDKYLSRPHNRRIKYSKLKIKYPFNYHWLELVNGWRTDENVSDNYFVLRDRKLLNLLNISLKKFKPLPEELWNESFIHNAIVAVKIVSIGKGTPKPYSMICLPTEDDLKTIKNLNLCEPAAPKPARPDLTTSDNQKSHSLSAEEEFLSFDEKLGKEIDLNSFFTDKHEEKLLKRKLKEKQRKKQKKLGLKRPAPPDSPIFRELSLKNVVDTCSRRIMGFTVVGDYSFAIGRGVGLGFCSLTSLKYYLKNLPIFKNNRITTPVLYRNTNSRLFRAANLEILLGNK